MQDLQGQMNSKNDSGRFREVEPNHSVRLSCVPSQPATLPSPRSMLSRDKRLPLDTWNLSEPQGNFLVISFFTSLSRTKIIIKEFIFLRHQVLQDRLHGDLSQEMNIEIRAQFQCRHLQEGRRPQVHYFRWKFHRTLWWDSNDSRYRNCNSTNSLHFPHHDVGRLEDMIQKSSDYLFCLSIVCNVKNQRSGDG